MTKNTDKLYVFETIQFKKYFYLRNNLKIISQKYIVCSHCYQSLLNSKFLYEHQLKNTHKQVRKLIVGS
jgi:hypothetical protein